MYPCGKRKNYFPQNFMKTLSMITNTMKKKTHGKAPAILFWHRLLFHNIHCFLDNNFTSVIDSRFIHNNNPSNLFEERKKKKEVSEERAR